jgi:hypothetical protein
MVKLVFYVVKKRYKRKVYEHESICLHFPKELHEVLQYLRNQELKVKAIREGNTTHITLVEKQGK